MATFQYEAMNSVGQPVRGEVDANTSEEAISKVRAMGNFPTKIKERLLKRGAKVPGAKAEPARAGRRSVGKVARKRGMRTLRESGMLSIFDGLTTMEEVVAQTIMEDTD